MSWFTKALNQIKFAKISHRNWSRALAETFSALIASVPGEVICLTGPSRGGKSRLIKEVSQLIVGNPQLSDEDKMTCVSILAANCGPRGSFLTKSFTTRGLEAIKHPFYGINSVEDIWSVERHRMLERTSEGILRPALETGLKSRKTKYLFIDEAQHVRYVAGGDSAAAAILDSWKGMAETAGVVLVLVGAYPLLEVIRHCPHLLGRKQQIHLPRYYVNKQDLGCFNDILKAYDTCLGIKDVSSSLCNWNELLYKQSFGCIGLVEKWLRAAMAYADAHGKTTLEKTDFIATKQSALELNEIAKEIADGEVALEKQYSSDEEAVKPSISKPKSTKKRASKPFQRKPKRHEIDGRS